MLKYTESVFQNDSFVFSKHLRSICANKNVDFYIVPGAFINVEFSNLFFDAWNKIYPNALGNMLYFEYPLDYFSNTRWHLGAITLTSQIGNLLEETGCFNR